jgi:hypothetical protein
MPLIPLDIPPGFVRNGTDLQSSGRWRDGSLVRWREGSLRPIGGWAERIASMFSAAPRGMHAWQDVNGSRWLAGGTYSSLKVATSGGTVYDITPSGLTAGLEDAELASGYGSGFYGTGLYGVAPLTSGTYSEATTWSLDNWGENLVACSYADGTLYEWALNTAADAVAITNAPTNCLGLMVTEERFLFALGAGGNPRKIAWSDQEDNTTWSPAATNQAGDFELATAGQIMAAVRTTGQTLILTDIDAHRATYQGPPFVYGFERVGQACGLVARKAVASTDAGVFWMGQKGFYRFDGSSVRELPCSVSDHVFLDIRLDQISKSWAVTNGQNGEVWWFYVSGDSSDSEIDSYVAYDYKEDHWLIGKLSRTAGVDRGVFRQPIYASSGGSAYNHETGFNYDSQEVYAESGPVRLGAGETLFHALKLIPDELTQGGVTASFKARNYPNTNANADSLEREYGPFSMANPTDIRFSGRQLRMRVTSSGSGAWRWGIPSLELVAAGRR